MMMATFRFNGSSDEDRNRCFCIGGYYTGRNDENNSLLYIITDDNGEEWRISVSDAEFEVYDIFNA